MDLHALPGGNKCGNKNNILIMIKHFKEYNENNTSVLKMIRKIEFPYYLYLISTNIFNVVEDYC